MKGQKKVDLEMLLLLLLSLLLLGQCGAQVPESRAAHLALEVAPVGDPGAQVGLETQRTLVVYLVSVVFR